MTIELINFVYFFIIVSVLNSILFKNYFNKLNCGIIGFSAFNTQSTFNYNKIQNLFIINELERGGDGLGVYTPNNGLIKSLNYANIYFLKNKLLPDNTLIGHTRKSSVGGVTLINNHPFEYDNIIGCHNGTLHFFKDLAEKYDIKSTEYRIDSEVLLLGIDNSINNGENYPKILNDYSGAAALLYYDKTAETLHAFRDDERPLFYGVCEEGMYISSLQYTLELIGCTDIQSFEKNKLYFIKNGVITKTISSNRTTCNLVTRDEYLKKEFTIGMPNNKYTGISPDNISVLSLIQGLNVRYTGEYKLLYPKSNYISSFALEKGNIYTITSAKTFNITIECVKTGKITNTFLNDEFIKNFSLDSCLPVIGNKVKLLKNLVKVENKKHLANAGDIVEVVSYKIGSNIVECKIKNKGLYTVKTELLLAMNPKTEPKIEEEYYENSLSFNNIEYPPSSIPENLNDFILREDVILFASAILEEMENISNMDDVKTLSSNLKELIDSREFENYILNN